MMLTKLTTVTAVLLVLGMVAFGSELPDRQTAADEKITEGKMFPDGREYDFGKVKRGAPVKLEFRIVNTSDVTLTLISIRTG